MEFFKEKPQTIATNYPSAMNFLGSRCDAIEKISSSDEKHFQIEKLKLYLSALNMSLESVYNKNDLLSELREFSLKWSSLKIQEASEQLDLHISQAINGLDEIDKILNTVGTRMREWYGLHFPELDNLLQNIVTYAQIVSQDWKTRQDYKRIS